MREALAAYLRFAGARTLEWAPTLGREKRLFGVRPGRRASASAPAPATSGATDPAAGW